MKNNFIKGGRYLCNTLYILREPGYLILLINGCYAWADTNLSHNSEGYSTMQVSEINYKYRFVHRNGRQLTCNRAGAGMSVAVYTISV